MNAIIGVSLVVVTGIVTAGCLLLLLNRSRWTLEQAVERSGYKREELLAMIRAGWLEYRRRYGCAGAYSVDGSELARAYADYQEALRIQTETDALLVAKVEEMAAAFQEAVRQKQRERGGQQEEVEKVESRKYDALLHRMSRQFGVVPPEVAQAFRVLDLPQHASFTTIQRRYHLLVKRVHPDVGGESQQFIRVHAAYMRVLSWLRSQQVGDENRED